MAESVTISPTPPEFKSMQYDYLRSVGLKHIQDLSGKIWTNYNLSDPGVSILEVLGYAITDLGYRTSYPIPDILAQNPDPNVTKFDSKNFYTAGRILPVNPVTINDYRKLLIDCEVYEDQSETCNHVGVKNAWIEMLDSNELPIYVNDNLKKLQYTPANVQKPWQVKPTLLYNVLLELGSCEKYGDLNDTKVGGYVTIIQCSAPNSLPLSFIGMKVKVEIDFPRWDDANVDWTDKASIKNAVKRATVNFPNMPDTYTLEGYGIDGNKNVYVTIHDLIGNPVDEVVCVENQINDLAYGAASDSLISLYQKKVQKIQEVIAAARKTIMAHRNLNEDFYRIGAMKVEEVAMCADIEVTADAHVEEIEARIYFELDKFISPSVNFHTLEEMYAKGKTTDEIFDGPALRHGFIDTEELENAKRRKVINVSDLISIIMDIPGVVAVKKIQIANLPEDNDDNIISNTVKWQLKLAYDKNYVPRLSTETSKINFFKGPLPFISHEVEVDALLAELRRTTRGQKIIDAVVDLPEPEGEYKNIAEYVSVQDEFPLVYGIGPEGLPATADDTRKAQAKQLKGFLMFFDQILANYLAQLQGVKELFSMNMEAGLDNDYLVNKSYFTRGLEDAVTDFIDLRQATSNNDYKQNVQDYTEGSDLFYKRRNKFLDHLMARFSEQFTDYAMLVYKISGRKAPAELVTDKLTMLNAYPEISSCRFKGFDYEDQSRLWHVDNVSGYEKRISLLNGINPREASSLNFTKSFPATKNNSIKAYKVLDANTLDILHIPRSFDTTDEWKLWIERVVINGSQRERYEVLDVNNEPVTEYNPTDSYKFRLLDNNGTVLALSPSTFPVSLITEYPEGQAFPYNLPYSGDPLSGAYIETRLNEVIKVLKNEFLNNPEANRANMALPLTSYFDVQTPVVDMTTNPPHYTIDFDLYKQPFDFTGGNPLLLSGSYKGNGVPKTAVKIKAITANNTLVVWGNLATKISSANNQYINIDQSSNNTNNGPYTVSSVSYNGTNETTIVVTATTLVSGGVLGNLYYNTQTSAALLSEATAKTKQALYEVAYCGSNTNNYKVRVQNDSSYRFNIVDRCGDTLATSSESDFLSQMAAELTGRNFTIENNSANSNTTRTAGSVTTEENLLVVPVTATLNASTGGELVFSGSHSVNNVNKTQQYFVITGTSLNRIVLPGDVITISGSTYNNGTYTVKNVLLNGSNSEIYVNESISSDAGNTQGNLNYTKRLPVVNIADDSGWKVYARFDVGNVAAQEVTAFITEKFFAHEGVHLVENFLLRPKTNKMVYVPLAADNSLTTRTTSDGFASYTKFYPIKSVYVDAGKHYFEILSDVRSEFDLTLLSPEEYTVIIKGSTSAINDRSYKIDQLSLNASGNTLLRVKGVIPSNQLSSQGNLYFRKKIGTSSFTAGSVTIAETYSTISGSYPLITSGTSGGANNGTFVIEKIENSSNLAKITLSKVLTEVSDHLLSIKLDAECKDCNIVNPYSFIGSTIMPYWQGRFINQDFRYFFEQTLRTECPAHMALNICWVSPAHMEEFEMKYKTWLLENARLRKDMRKYSAALNDLIDIIERLRSVNRQGTLHDCDQDPELKNAIILNKTTIGTLQI